MVRSLDSAHIVRKLGDQILSGRGELADHFNNSPIRWVNDHGLVADY